jgi:rhamnulokinase
MAEEAKDFPSRVDVNDDSFLAPENMTNAIKGYCKAKGEKVPETIGELAAVIYLSLADCYGQTVRQIEKNTGKTYESVHIIGGGANAAYLNQLTANATKKTVYAGPGEATAIGNLAAQMIAKEELKDLSDARKCIYRSFDVKEFKPL